MKAFDEKFSGRRGSIPPQLFKYIDTRNMAAETERFTEYMNAVAADLLGKNEKLEDAAGPVSDDMLNPVTPQLFGQDVTAEYIGNGMSGAVCRMQIGNVTFAFKVNFECGVIGDLRAISEYKRARNLINRPYIGATFEWCGKKYSWILSDYVADDYKNSFEDAKEKLFYAYMTKGLWYSDMLADNIKNGRIIDLDTVKHKAPDLPRIEIDMVKKFMALMRRDDVAAVRLLAEKAMLKHPTVISYMAKKMRECNHRLMMPLRMQKFRSIIAEYYARLAKQKCTASQSQTAR